MPKSSPNPDLRALARAHGPEPEDAFQSWLVDLLKTLGFEVYHTWRSTHSPEGFPDITAVGERRGTMRLLFFEAKGIDKHCRPGGVSPAQLRWITALKAVSGVHAAVVWPWQREEIVRELEAL